MSDCADRDRPLDAAAWEARYVEDNTPWDLGRAPPALVELLETLAGEPLRVLVPGAGRGSDAVAWAGAGHEVTAVDYAPSAVAATWSAGREAGVRLRAVEADVLALPCAFEAAFDAVWEQTCFCALEPHLRDDYARAMARVLRPGGRLFGLFWNHGRSDGPPWDVTEAIVRETFAPCFDIESLRAVTSVPERNREFLAILRRRD